MRTTLRHPKIRQLMKTPIKSEVTFYCAPIIQELIPANRKIKSLLLHSGQIEFDLSFSGSDLIVATNKYAIYEFWDCVLKNPYLVVEMADQLHQKLDPQMVYMLQEDWPKYRDPFFRSALFYILNRYSLNGSISHGNFSTNNYSHLSGRSLINFCETHDLQKINLKYYNKDNWFECEEFLDKEDVMLLPAGKFSASPLKNGVRSAYDAYAINDRAIKQTLCDFERDFVLVYKYSNTARNKFSDLNTIMVNKFGEITDNSQTAEDLIITNMDIP